MTKPESLFLLAQSPVQPTSHHGRFGFSAQTFNGPQNFRRQTQNVKCMRACRVSSAVILLLVIVGMMRGMRLLCLVRSADITPVIFWWALRHRHWPFV